MKDDFVNTTESELHWSYHEIIHSSLEKSIDQTDKNLNEKLQAAVIAHDKIHEIHVAAHEREHLMTSTALNKAEESMNRRLEGMNEFREQLKSQSATFLTRDVFDKYTDDMETKIELALSALSDKDEALIRSAINRHDSDFNSLRELIQAEREIRKAFEGSINTWKWLAGFLGASGVAGVILLFATRTTT